MPRVRPFLPSTSDEQGVKDVCGNWHYTLDGHVIDPSLYTIDIDNKAPVSSPKFVVESYDASKASQDAPYVKFTTFNIGVVFDAFPDFTPPTYLVDNPSSYATEMDFGTKDYCLGLTYSDPNLFYKGFN